MTTTSRSKAKTFVKSSAEVAVLRDNARATAVAVRAAMHAVTPGVRQRQVEMRAAQACLDAGAVGPSFWPWTMSGPNAHIPMLVRSVHSYDQLDRTMKAGETVRIDLGCTNHGYGGDVGRTVPVSGKFTAGQSEIWNLLIDAYRAGMRAMRPGVSIAQVMATSRAESAGADRSRRPRARRRPEFCWRLTAWRDGASTASVSRAPRRFSRRWWPER